MWSELKQIVTRNQHTLGEDALGALALVLLLFLGLYLPLFS